MRRMLDGPEHAVPGISMDIVIPEVHVEVKDKEFQLITAISSSNLNESLNVPPGVKALEQALALRRSNSQSLREWPGACDAASAGDVTFFIFRWLQLHTDRHLICVG